MFIDTTKFKKVVKASYDTLGLQVAHFDDGIVQISGIGFILEIDETDITNKCMAVLVECIGRLPGPGTAVKFMNKTKLDTMDVTMPEGHNLLERFTQGTQAQDTRLMIQRNSTCYSVFQTTDTYEPLLVRRELQNVVDIEKVDSEKDEMPPLAPVKSDNLIIWNNDTMQYAIVETPYHYDGEKDFLRLINGKDMCWPFD